MKLEEFREKLAKTTDEKVLKMASRKRSEIPEIAWKYIEEEIHRRGLTKPDSTDSKSGKNPETIEDKPATQTTSGFHPVLPMQEQEFIQQTEAEKQIALPDPVEQGPDREFISPEPETQSIQAIPSSLEEPVDIQHVSAESKARVFYPPVKSNNKTALDWDELVSNKVTMAVLLVAFSGIFATLMKSLFDNEQ